MIRDDIKSALVAAMKAKDAKTVSTLRLVQSALKNREIELRGGEARTDDDALVIEVLKKMVKQLQDSIVLYEQNGRADLAEGEKAEVALIEGFLPAQMSEAEIDATVGTVIAELEAGSMKDMGKVMAALQARHAATMDMKMASAKVKARLSA
ncbi:GatB/YqeY domain-containing protein [Stappia sp.]|jgi:uncharacterized protein YqeY|uniref:GatB/YqeY domain-containing protein n=1 Tax=Stappia sp. TaxID=1870903 RepID=UPI003A99D1E6